MKKKIVYCTPSLYIPGGVERVLTTKANYLADVAGYDVYIVLTDGKGKEPFYPLSPQIHIIQLDINFEELWGLPFINKIFIYLKKQRIYKLKLKKVLFAIKPDITISLLRREINFITSIKDGSVKIGELHVNKNNYRNFESTENNWYKEKFSQWWLNSFISKIKKLKYFIVLTNEDKNQWGNLTNLKVIHNPTPYFSNQISKLTNKEVIAVGRYTYQKGFDSLLKAWKIVSSHHKDWHLSIYGTGDRTVYQDLANKLGISNYCSLNTSIGKSIYEKYNESSIYILSSRFEGLPMVLLEASSCGLPIVSFSCPCGPKDIITDGVNGYLVEPGNVEALAERICYLIEHEELRKEMGKAARKRAEDFREEKIMQQWVDLFENIT